MLILACTPGVASAAPPESDDFESMLKGGQGTGCFQYFINQFGDGVLISYCGKDTIVEITGSCNVSGLRVPYGSNDVTMLDCGSMPSGTIRWCAADDYDCDFSAGSPSAEGIDKPTEDSFPDFSSPAQGTVGELPDSFPDFAAPSAPPGLPEPAIAPEPQQAEICDSEYCYPAGDPRQLPEGSREQLAALCMQEEKGKPGERYFGVLGSVEQCVAELDKLYPSKAEAPEFGVFEEAAAMPDEGEAAPFDADCRWDSQRGQWVHTQVTGASGPSLAECVTNALALSDQDKRDAAEAEAEERGHSPLAEAPVVMKSPVDGVSKPGTKISPDATHGPASQCTLVTPQGAPCVSCTARIVADAYMNLECTNQCAKSIRVNFCRQDDDGTGPCPGYGYAQPRRVTVVDQYFKSSTYTDARPVCE